MLAKSPAGHVLPNGVIANETPPSPGKAMKRKSFRPTLHPVNHANCLTPKRSRLTSNLDIAAKKQLADLLKLGRCKVDTAQIQRITHRCNCHRIVHRVDPPVVSSWIARFCGDVVAIDVVHPFADIGPAGLYPFGSGTGKHPSLLVSDSLTRFLACQLLQNLTPQEVSQTFMNDWAGRFGKPKRIVLTHGEHGLGGMEWGN